MLLQVTEFSFVWRLNNSSLCICGPFSGFIHGSLGTPSIPNDRFCYSHSHMSLENTLSYSLFKQDNPKSAMLGWSFSLLHVYEFIFFPHSDTTAYWRAGRYMVWMQSFIELATSLCQLYPTWTSLTNQALTVENGGARYWWPKVQKRDIIIFHK